MTLRQTGAHSAFTKNYNVSPILSFWLGEEFACHFHAVAMGVSMDMSRALCPRLFSERLTLMSPVDPEFDLTGTFLAPGAPGFIDAGDSIENLWWSMATIIGHWHLRGYGLFAMIDRDSGQAVGLVGPWQPQGWPEPELSWHLVQGHSGKGYATEGAECVLDWLFFDRGQSQIVSYIPDNNTASIALAQRLGAQPEGPVSFPLQLAPNMRIWRHDMAQRATSRAPAGRRLH